MKSKKTIACVKGRSSWIRPFALAVIWVCQGFYAIAQEGVVLRFADRFSSAAVRPEKAMIIKDADTLLVPVNAKGLSEPVVVDLPFRLVVQCGGYQGVDTLVSSHTLLLVRILMEKTWVKDSATVIGMGRQGNTITFDAKNMVVIPEETTKPDSLSLVSALKPELSSRHEEGQLAGTVQPREKVHVIWVIDRSASMRRQGQQTMMVGLFERVKTWLTSGDLVSQIDFATRCTPIWLGYPAERWEGYQYGPYDPPGSQSKVADALQMAYDLADSLANKVDHTAILLVTDGAVMLYKHKLLERVSRATNQRVHLHIAGLGVLPEYVGSLADLAQRGKGLWIDLSKEEDEFEQMRFRLVTFARQDNK